MKCSFVIFVLVSLNHTSFSFDLVDLLHQLPAHPEPSYCILQSGTQRGLIQKVFEDVSKNGYQQIVVTGNDFIFSGKKFSHYVVSFDDDSWSFTVKQFDNLLKHRGWNNLGYLFFLSGSRFNVGILSKYGNLMKMLGVTKSVIFFSEFQQFGYDYFADNFLKFSNAASMMHHLQQDRLTDTNGYVLRISVFSFYTSIIILYNPLQVRGTTAMFLEAFAEHLNATIHWQVDSRDPTTFDNMIL